MCTIQNLQSKSNPFTTSSQVKKILHSKGYSSLFNWLDFKDYKKACKNSFNLAYSIADKFLKNAEQESDFNEYIF